MQLFHNVTIFGWYMYLLFETSPDFIFLFYFIYLFIYFFFFWGGGGGGGGLAPMYLLLGDIYWFLGRQGYFGISNVALVLTTKVHIILEVWQYIFPWYSKLAVTWAFWTFAETLGTSTFQRHQMSIMASEITGDLNVSLAASPVAKKKIYIYKI